MCACVLLAFGKLVEHYGMATFIAINMRMYSIEKSGHWAVCVYVHRCVLQGGLVLISMTSSTDQWTRQELTVAVS